jgi:hypothetical protein
MNILDDEVYHAIIDGDIEKDEWIKELFLTFLLENFADLKNSDVVPKCQHTNTDEFKRHMTAGMHHGLFKLQFYKNFKDPDVILTKKAETIIESFVTL